MPSIFQSISSLFSSQRDGSHLRRDQAMVSVDDAFTVPPDTEHVSTPTAYTYPPPAQGGSYDTVPQSSYTHSSYDLRSPLSVGGSSSGTRTQPTPLLPIHHSPLSPLPKYPSLQQTWNRLRSWLDDQYPELADTLNWGIQPPELAHLELQLGITLPQAVRESYLVVDGQEAESSAGCSEGLFFGLTLLPFEDVVEEWRLWREVDDDPATGANPELRENMRSIPPGWIRREYSQRGWLPLVADKAGNFLGVDMNPDDRGSVGQVIVFGRDFDTKVVMWRGDGEAGWARWLANFVEEIESGEGFELGVNEGSEGSEDGVGYESYFFDGATAKGQGSGESNGGGLRLTGEYRGWASLEALADRSMRRWIEAGVMSPPTPNDEAGSSSAKGSSSTLDTGASPIGEYGAQRDVWKSVLNGDTGSGHTHTPSVSATKVPAPIPLQLPTEQDLLPYTNSSPTETTPVYDHDEEMGGLPMREVDRTTPVQANFPPSVEEATLVPLPSSTAVSPSKAPSPVSIDAPLEHPILQTTDPFDPPSLLTTTTPIELSVSSSIDATRAPQVAPSSTILTPILVNSSTPTPSESPAAEEGSQPSIRLVSGGGTSGPLSLMDEVLVADKSHASTLNKKNSLDSVSSDSSGKRKKE